MPRSLRQILATRLDALPADARDAAEFLAGLGRVPVGRFTSDRAVGLQTLLTNGLVTIEDRGDGRGASAGFTHPLFKKTVRRSKKYKAHDESNQFKVGDSVRIIECAPRRTARSAA